jgi:uncharacterized protein
VIEAQLRPGLFPLLRALIVRSNKPGHYLLLGSAAPELLRQAGESLLGRVEIIEVAGFDLSEVSTDAQTSLWQGGGFPPSYFANGDDASFIWRNSAINRYVEQDLRQLGIDIAPLAMMRFWNLHKVLAFHNPPFVNTSIH